MHDIANNVLRINDTAEECISGIVGNRSVSLTVVGPTAHLTAVQRSLKSNGLEHEIRQHSRLARWAKGTESVSRGWEELVGPVELRQIDADHFSMLKNPAVSHIWYFALLELGANNI